MQRPEFIVDRRGHDARHGSTRHFCRARDEEKVVRLHNRCKFDPNKTWSVSTRGRERQDAPEGSRQRRADSRMERLATEPQESGQQRQEASTRPMLLLGSVTETSPSVSQQVSRGLQSLAGVRKSVGHGWSAATA